MKWWRWRARWLVVGLLAAGVGLGACGGKRASGPGSDAATARRAGSFAAAITQAELGRFVLPALDAYLAGLVERLAAGAPGSALRWRVAVLDEPEALAVGFDAGHLLLSRGLLVHVEGETQLLRVLATEMAHVGLGHASRRLTELAKRKAPGSPGEAADLVLPGLGRPLSSVGNLAASLRAVPYPVEARREVTPVVDAMLAGAQAAAADAAVFPWPLAGLVVGVDPRGGSVEDARLRHPALDLAIDFPRGWSVSNLADVAQAVSPDAEARILFQLVAEGDDPVAPARAFAQAGGARFGLLPRAREIGGKRAARARGSAAAAVVDVTWLAQAGRIYQLTGVCAPRDYDRLQVDFIDVALSLRSAGTPAADPARLAPVFLHVEAAEAGESLAALLARTGGSAWTLEEVAALAGLSPGAALGAGAALRVPRRSPLPLPPSEPEVGTARAAPP